MHDKLGKPGGAWESLETPGEAWGSLGEPGEAWGSLGEPGVPCGSQRRGKQQENDSRWLSYRNLYCSKKQHAHPMRKGQTMLSKLIHAPADFKQT